jgi:hypothetical protein
MDCPICVLKRGRYCLQQIVIRLLKQLLHLANHRETVSICKSLSWQCEVLGVDVFGILSMILSAAYHASNTILTNRIVSPFPHDHRWSAVTSGLV